MFQASFASWIQLLGGVLTVGVIGLAVGIIEEKRRRSHQASGVTVMAKFTATVEQAGDGSWTAAIIGENIVLGVGGTREEALEDLRKGLAVRSAN